MKPIFTDHARLEAARRKIDEKAIEAAVASPQQRLFSSRERVILQSKYYDEHERREMLLRIIGEESFDVFRVITVYKTSKIDKYWIKEGA